MWGGCGLGLAQAAIGQRLLDAAREKLIFSNLVLTNNPSTIIRAPNPNFTEMTTREKLQLETNERLKDIKL